MVVKGWLKMSSTWSLDMKNWRHRPRTGPLQKFGLGVTAVVVVEMTACSSREENRF